MLWDVMDWNGKEGGRVGCGRIKMEWNRMEWSAIEWNQNVREKSAH